MRITVSDSLLIDSSNIFARPPGYKRGGFALHIPYPALRLRHSLNLARDAEYSRLVHRDCLLRKRNECQSFRARGPGQAIVERCERDALASPALQIQAAGELYSVAGA
jgi:hypothetical protein